MKPDAALGRTGRDIVLDAVTFKYGHRTVVATNGQSDCHARPRVFRAITNVLGEIDRISRGIELSSCHFEDVRIVKRGIDYF